MAKWEETNKKKNSGPPSNTQKTKTLGNNKNHWKPEMNRGDPRV